MLLLDPVLCVLIVVASLLFISGVNYLLLVGSGLGEAQGDSVSGQLVVAVSDGGDLVLHDLLVERVKEDLLVLLSVDVHSDLLASDV